MLQMESKTHKSTHKADEIEQDGARTLATRIDTTTLKHSTYKQLETPTKQLLLHLLFYNHRLQKL